MKCLRYQQKLNENIFQNHRISILQLALKCKLPLSDDIDWKFFGDKTEGWVVQDIADLAEKAIFAAWKRYRES